MKQIYQLLTKGVVLLLFSCGSDGDMPKAESLTGKWNVTNFDFIQCDDPSKNVQRNCTTAATYCTLWEFAADGNLTVTYSSGGRDVSTYTLFAGNSVVICRNNSCSNWFYSIAGNKLTLTMALSVAGDGCLHQYSFVKS